MSTDSEQAPEATEHFPDPKTVLPFEDNHPPIDSELGSSDDVDEHEGSASLGVKSNETPSRVNASKDGSASDESPLGAASDQSRSSLPFLEGIRLLDLESQDKLKHCRYFLVYGQDGLFIPYCWGVNAQASSVSHVYRIVDHGGKAILDLAYTFNHLDPIVGPRVEALDHEFYLPRVELRRLPVVGDEFTPTILFFNGREALRAASAYNDISTQLKSGVGSGDILRSSDPLPQSTNLESLDQPSVHIRPRPLPPSVFPQSEPSTSACVLDNTFGIASNFVAAQDDQVGLTIGSSIQGFADELSDTQSFSTQQLECVPATDAFDHASHPEPSVPCSISRHPPNVRVTHSEQAICTLVVSDPVSHPIIPQIAIMASDGWPPSQILHVTELNPTLESIEAFSKEFSWRLKKRGLHIAHCWHCRYISRKPVEKCKLKNLKAWSLQRHLMAHFRLYEHFCPKTGCGKGTVTKQQLDKHIGSKHPEIWKTLKNAL